MYNCLVSVENCSSKRKELTFLSKFQKQFLSHNTMVKIVSVFHGCDNASINALQ